MMLNARKRRRAKTAGRCAFEQSASVGNRIKILGEADDVEDKKGSESKDGQLINANVNTREQNATLGNKI